MSDEQEREAAIVPDFPNKGKYCVRDSRGNHTGWADEPQYNGQMPNRFPPEWSPLQCFLVAAYINSGDHLTAAEGEG